MSQEILGLTVVAAFVTMIGNLLALYLKDYLGARSFERWKAAESLVAVYNKYRKSIALAAQELASRCHLIAVRRPDDPRNKLGLAMLRSKQRPGVGCAVIAVGLVKAWHHVWRGRTSP